MGKRWGAWGKGGGYGGKVGSMGEEWGMGEHAQGTNTCMKKNPLFNRVLCTENENFEELKNLKTYV